MSNVIPFDPAVKSRRKSVPHPGAPTPSTPSPSVATVKEGEEARAALFASIDEIKSLVEAGTVTMVTVTVAGKEGARHLTWDCAEADINDAAQTILALRLASDAIVDDIKTANEGTCAGCGCELE